MSPSQLLAHTEQKFKVAHEHFVAETKKLRTGRAQPSMLEGVTVMAYGQPMPLIQLASISAPEATLLQITPFDPGNLSAITQAIRDNQTLGLNPTDDGRVVRVPVPAPTTERRQEIVKVLHEKVEECMITLRQARHDALREVDQAKKDKDIGEDEHGRITKQIDDLMNKQRSAIEAIAKDKEQEIMTL